MYCAATQTACPQGVAGVSASLGYETAFDGATTSLLPAAVVRREGHGMPWQQQ